MPGLASRVNWLWCGVFNGGTWTVPHGINSGYRGSPDGGEYGISYGELVDGYGGEKRIKCDGININILKKE